MNRSHFVTLGSAALIAVIPFAAHAAVAAFSGQIIPDVCNCIGSFSSPDHTTTVQTSAPDWGCVLQSLQSLISFIVYFASIIITLFIAWAGYTYMTSGGNPEKRSLANKRIMNAVIGLLIVLTAWLLVDSIMKYFYNPAGTTFAFGPWNSILADTKGNDNCFLPTNKPPPLNIVAQTSGGAPPATSSHPSTPPQSTTPSAPSTGAPTNFNTSSAVSCLHAHEVPVPGNGYCARAVRECAAAGGVTYTCPSFLAPSGKQEVWADRCGGAVQQAGFNPIGSDDSSPQVGDIVIIQAYPGGNQAGHTAMYDGTQWVSDFAQQDFWGGSGYRSYQPAHEFYRHS